MQAGWAVQVAVRAAWSCLRHHRWRSLLTLAVCGLGTAGVLVASVLNRAHIAEVRARTRGLGGDLLMVSPNVRPPYPGRPRQLEHFISLDPDDAAALATRLRNVRAIVPIVTRDMTIRSEGRATRTRLVSTNADYLHLRDFTLASGRFLAAADESDRVIVLGHAVSAELAGTRPGQQVYVGTAPYLVVGVLRPQGVNFAGDDEDHQVFIPLETYQRRIANRPWLNYLFVELTPEADKPETMRQAQELLRKRHGRWPDQVEDTIVRDFADLAAKQSEFLATVTWAVSATSSLLLLVGVAGIASLMVLMVRQRRTEIALRRALGATPLDVAVQFFLEGTILATTGVLAGLGIGALAARLLLHFMAAPVGLDAGLVCLSMAVSLGASTLACTLPALLAARTEPGSVLRA